RANGRTIFSSPSCVRTGRDPPPEASEGGLSRVACVARQHRQIDAELCQRAAPFRVVVAGEDNVGVGGNGKPAIGLDLGVELTGRPAGIAKGEEALARPSAFADRAQNLQSGGYRDIAI